MTTTLEAVYDHGTFRPLEPIMLPEGKYATITIVDNEPQLAITGADPRRLAEILAEIAAMPMEPGAEGFSNRDHDKVLYGENGAR